MKQWLFAAFLVALSAPALADTYRFDLQVVSSGDSTAKLMRAAGKPDQVTPIENEYSARIGERWTYFRDGKTITFTIDTEGRVGSIVETR